MARFSARASGLSLVLFVALAAAGQLEAGSAGHLTADDGADGGADDLVALIQHGARTQRRGAAASLGGRLGLLASLAKSNRTARGEFDCSAHPALCKEPFNCDKWDGKLAGLMEGVAAGGWSVDGKVDWQQWCANPAYEPYAAKCAAGDLDGAGRLQAEMTKAGAFGEHVDELDASYCFIDGHCVNSDVTNDTTLDEAVEQCDERFGRDAWAHVGSAGFVMDTMSHFTRPDDPANGFTSSSQTRPFLLMACAMGNYHCDVRYCQVSYCREEYYVKKYGHFLKDYGWVQ